MRYLLILTALLPYCLTALLPYCLTALLSFQSVNALDFDDTKVLADQGDVDAQNNLGVMYDNGNGVPENDAEAVKWFRKAANQGDATAQ